MKNEIIASKNYAKSFNPYREDKIFSLSISQHAAVSLLCERIMEHIASTTISVKGLENITSKPVFANRYKPLYRQITNFSENTNEEFEKYFKSKVEIIRNYFSHYKISTNNIENLFKSDDFCQLGNLLQTKALLLWKEQHETYANDIEERRNLFQNMSKDTFNTLDQILSSYFDKEIKSKYPNFKPSYFFLFLSIFATRSEMFKFCSALHNLKVDSEKDTQKIKEEKESYRELLTILSLRESHDVFAQNENYIVALTTLNHFAMQFGYIKDKYNNSLKKEPKIPDNKKELPEICKYHSSHFFLKMAIAFIETSDILPGIKFARFGDYKLGSKDKERIQPSFNDKDLSHELFIRNNSIPIQFVEDEKILHGQLGISAIMLILQTWISLAEDKQKQFSKDCTNHIINAINNTLSDSENKNPQYNMLLPKACIREKVKVNTDIVYSIESKRNAIGQDYFYISCPAHKKAKFIIWWIIRKVTVYTSEKINFTKQLQKDDYEKLLFSLLNSNWDSKVIAEFFPEIPEKKLSFVNKKYTIQKMITSSDSLEILFRRIKSDFLHETDIDNSDEKKLEHIAKLINLRRIKPNNGNVHNSYSKYLSNRISPNVTYFLSLNRFKREFNLEQNRKRYLEESSADLYNLLKYYKADDYKITNTKAREIYQRDMLLIELAKKTLTNHLPKNMALNIENNPFKYTIKLPVEDTNCTLIINGEHQRKLYNYLNTSALKFIIENYWKPINTEAEIPLHANEEKKHDNPRSFFDCVQQMEQERSFLIEVFLEFEKEKYIEAENKAKQDNQELSEVGGGESDIRVEFNTILEYLNELSSDDINIITKYRNKAFHQVPESPFNTVPEPIKTLFQNKIKNREEKRKNQKQKGLKKQN